MRVWELVGRGQTRQGVKASTVETQTRLRGGSWPVSQKAPDRGRGEESPAQS